MLFTRLHIYSSRLFILGNWIQWQTYTTFDVFQNVQQITLKTKTASFSLSFSFKKIQISESFDLLLQYRIDVFFGREDIFLVIFVWRAREGLNRKPAVVFSELIMHLLWPPNELKNIFPPKKSRQICKPHYRENFGVFHEMLYRFSPERCLPKMAIFRKKCQLNKNSL